MIAAGSVTDTGKPVLLWQARVLPHQVRTAEEHFAELEGEPDPMAAQAARQRHPIASGRGKDKGQGRGQRHWLRIECPAGRRRASARRRGA